MKPTSTIPTITILKRLDGVALNQADRQFVTGCLSLHDDSHGFSEAQRRLVEKMARTYKIDLTDYASPLGNFNLGPMVKIPPSRKPWWVAKAMADESLGRA